MQGKRILNAGTSEGINDATKDKHNAQYTISFTIYGRLESLNEYIEKCRRNKFAGGSMKKKSQQMALGFIEPALIETPVHLIYRFYEPNNKRDCDNVASYAIKVIQDAIVEAGIIPDDSRKYITGYEVEFYTDKENPRIEVVMTSER